MEVNQDNLVETTSAADIPMFLFDYNTKNLSLNENIIIETLEADDSAIFPIQIILLKLWMLLKNTVG